MITRRTAEMRARKGAEALDRLDKNWVLRVDEETLDVGSTTDCPVAQWRECCYHEAVEEVARRLGGRREMMLSGFELGNSGTGSTIENMLMYNLLTTAWKEQVRKRKTVALPAALAPKTSGIPTSPFVTCA